MAALFFLSKVSVVSWLESIAVCAYVTRLQAFAPNSGDIRILGSDKDKRLGGWECSVGHWECSYRHDGQVQKCSNKIVSLGFIDRAISQTDWKEDTNHH